jgi:hypothetical protein
VVVVSMSKQEFSRLDVLLRVQSGRLRVSDACVLIGLQRRQVFRLLRGLKQDGATSLLSKRRGRPSNHRLPAEVRTLALSIVRDRYAGFGPSLRNFREATLNANRLMDQLNQIAAENRRPIRQFTEGSLPDLSALIIDARTTVNKATAVLDSLERNPARFIFGNKMDQGVQLK